MKKGFTLIELLAVILILSIIALIAIPTVNNILKESRRGAFEAGANNIMKYMEEACQTSLIKNENPTLSYTFTEGKTNIELDIKGELPYEGYVLLSKECTVTDFYLSDKNNIYSNTDDIRYDQMLKASTETNVSIFKKMYSDYYDNIISVSFINNLNIPEEAIEVKDPSVSEIGNIKSWLVPNGSNYDLYIGSNNTIYANIDSKYLFKDMINVKSIEFSNFNTSLTKSMGGLFYKAINLTSINLENYDTSNVEDMGSMFRDCRNLITIDLTGFNTSKLVDISCMFRDCHKLQEIKFGNFDTSNVSRMQQLFMYCGLLKTIDVKNFKLKNNAVLMSLFCYCHGLETLDISGWDLTNVNSLNDIFVSAGIKTLIVKDAATINKLNQYLATKDESTPGTIQIVGDKANLDLDALATKNWNVI